MAKSTWSGRFHRLEKWYHLAEHIITIDFGFRVVRGRKLVEASSLPLFNHLRCLSVVHFNAISMIEQVRVEGSLSSPRKGVHLQILLAEH